MNNIDKLFEEEIKKNQIPYSESHWEAMDALIQKDKKKKFFVFFTSAALIVSILSIGVYYGFQSKTISSETQKNVNQSNTTQVYENKANPTLEQSVKTPLQTNKTTTSAFDKTTRTAIDKAKTYENNTINGALRQNQSTIESSPQKEDIIQSLNTDNSVSISNAESNFTLSSSGSNELTNADNSILNVQYTTLKSIQYFKLNLKSDIGYIARLNMLDKLLALHPKDPEKPVKEWFLSPYINYNYFSAPIYAANISALKSNEELKKTLGYGLNVKLKLGHWSLSSGLQYNTFKALANYNINQRLVSYDTSLTVVNYDYSKTSLGTRIALLKRTIDSSVTTSSAIIHPNEKISFTYIGLPLNIQYNMGYKKFSYFIETGLTSQFLMVQKGRYLELKNGNASFEEVNYQQNKVLINAQIGIGFSYPIIKNVSVFSAYNYITNLNSMVSGYSQKMGINRINFGFDFKLK